MAELETPTAWRVARARVRRVAASPLGILSLAATAASVAVVVISGGSTLENADGYTALTVWNTVTFVAAGLYWQTWRPANPLGRLLIASGFLIAGLAMQGAANSVVFAAGMLFEGPAFLVVLYVLFAYPSGALDRLGRIGFAAGAAYVVFLFLPWLLTEENVQGTAPLAKCGSACPENVLQVAPSSGAEHVLGEALPPGRFVVMTVICAVLVLRIARAKRPQRRMLMPVTALGLLWIALIGVYALTGRIAGPGSTWTTNVGFGVTMARAMLPAAFLLAPLQARAFAGIALQRMLRRFELAPTLAAGQRVIATTLDDPTLKVGFWLPQSRRYVDVNLAPMERPDPGSGIAWTSIDRGGEPVAALTHDPALVDDPELIEAAGHALVLTLNSRRLEHELQRSVADLQRSRRLLLAADAAERRRLERELHGTAQQHLVALRVGLELARGRAETNTALAERLTVLGRNLDRTVDDLRRIATGIYSPLLEEAGLRTALEDAARSSVRPLELDVEEIGRLAPEVEAGLYFSIIEAVSNAVAYSGEDATIRVRLAREADGVHFSVSDDGIGFDADEASRGPGLQGIRERLAAVGGVVEVVSVPGRGSIVSGTVPVGRAEATFDSRETV